MKKIEDMVRLVEEDQVPTGWSKYNHNAHLVVEIPDDNFTITCRTSEGKQVTFAFMAYEHGKPPQCVDVQWANSERHVAGREGVPLFDVLGLAPTPGPNPFDTRITERPVSVASILLHGKLPHQK